MNVLLRAGALVAVAAVAGCSVTVSGDGRPGEGAREALALQSFLLSPAEINAAMGAEGMVAAATQSTLVEDGGRTNPTQCLSVSSVGQEHVYSDAGWTAVRVQSLHEEGADFEHLVHQGVIEFSTQAQAAEFLTDSAGIWAACARAGRYAYRSPEADAVWLVGSVDDEDSVLALVTPQQLGEGWTCQRALAAAVNVVADVMTCSYDIEDRAAVTIAGQIADRAAG